MGDRHARTCKLGGHPIAFHDEICAALGGVALRWGIHVTFERRTYLPTRWRMDLSFVGAAPDGSTLRVDVTRREGTARGRRPERESGTGSHLERAERYKRQKYAHFYRHAGQWMEGFAVNSYGGLGPGAVRVVQLLAALGSQLTGRPAPELRREMEWALGFTLARYGAYLEQVAGMRARAECWYPRVRAVRLVGTELVVDPYTRKRGGLAASVAVAAAARAMMAEQVTAAAQAVRGGADAPLVGEDDAGSDGEMTV